MPRFPFRAATLLAALSVSTFCHAHFPWLAVDQEGKAILVFGETPAARTYKLPPTIKQAKQMDVSDPKPLNIKADVVETEELIGFVSTDKPRPDRSVACQVTYGIYHGSRLDYFAQHVGQLSESSDVEASLPEQFELQVRLVDTASGVDAYVTSAGKPLADAEVKLFCEEGHEEADAKTDSQGKVSFTDKEVESGLNGIMVGTTSESESGTLDGQEYKAVSRYLTATFYDPQDDARTVIVTPHQDQPESKGKVTVSSERYPSIPQAVTSFGAAIAGDKLYLYGGHTGRAHQYYMEAQANTLWQLDLKQPSGWKALGNGPRLQGLAMVSDGKKLYRIGGFTAKNKEGEDKNLHSQAAVAAYDPATGKWADLPALPEPRSSFDAVVANHAIYVIGGWAMTGEETDWHETAYKLDLGQQPLKWDALPEPGFQRRALSVAALDGKVYAIGGMQRVGGPSTRVDVFDTKTQKWSRGPDMPGEGMEGFGSSAFSVDGRLYVTTFTGTLLRLSEDGKSWDDLHLLEHDRFFHRMLPLAGNKLLTVGGANMSSGKFAELDIIHLP